MNWIRRNEPPRTAARRLDGQRLGEAGHALDQEVAAGDEADEHPLEHLVLSDDDPLDLDERLLEERARRVEIAIGRALWRRGGSRDDGLLSGADIGTPRVDVGCERPAGGAPVARW